MSDQLKINMSSTSMESKRWWVQISFFFLSIFALNVVPDITAESILGCKDDSETKKFETCEINENDLDKESSKLEEVTKNQDQKKLFLSEGGW